MLDFLKNNEYSGVAILKIVKKWIYYYMNIYLLIMYKKFKEFKLFVQIYKCAKVRGCYQKAVFIY